jgi:hypothetical protein
MLSETLEARPGFQKWQAEAGKGCGLDEALAGVVLVRTGYNSHRALRVVSSGKATSVEEDGGTYG